MPQGRTLFTRSKRKADEEKMAQVAKRSKKGKGTYVLSEIVVEVDDDDDDDEFCTPSKGRRLQRKGKLLLCLRM